MESINQKHILIVEDSEDLQDLLTQLFTAEGYKVTQAFHGQQALDLLRSMDSLPSLILLDIMMPVMDGVKFREEQKKDPRLALIPAIVMTADANYQSKQNLLDAKDLFHKPITDIEKLFRSVEQFRIP